MSWYKTVLVSRDLFGHSTPLFSGFVFVILVLVFHSYVLLPKQALRSGVIVQEVPVATLCIWMHLHTAAKEYQGKA